jgi:hypothetical protein
VLIGGRSEVLPATAPEHFIPDFTSKYASQEQVIDGFNSLGGKSADNAILQTVLLPTVCCPAAAMQGLANRRSGSCWEPSCSKSPLPQDQCLIMKKSTVSRARRVGPRGAPLPHKAVRGVLVEHKVVKPLSNGQVLCHDRDSARPGYVPDPSILLQRHCHRGLVAPSQRN